MLDAGPFLVMCAVSGGITGSRQGPMKSDGRILEFETREAAEAEAAKSRADKSPYGSARFSYWVVPRAGSGF